MKENPLKPIEGVGLEVLRKPNGDDDKGSSERSALQTAQEKKYFFSLQEPLRLSVACAR
jgi:hypothetical protein